MLVEQKMLTQESDLLVLFGTRFFCPIWLTVRCPRPCRKALTVRN